MRLSSILSEALRNIAAGTTRGVLLMLVFAGVVGMAGLADVRTASAVLEQIYQYDENGGSTLILNAEDAVDGRQCEAIAHVAGVVASGAMRAIDSANPTVVPSSLVPAYEVTPGFLDVIEAQGDRATPGVYVSERLAASLGARSGRDLPLLQGIAQVAGVFNDPDDGRLPILQGAVLLPLLPLGAFDQCWIRTSPQFDVRALSLTALRPDVPEDTKIETNQLNSKLGSMPPSAIDFSERTTAIAPLLGGICSLVLGFFAVWGRRLELVSALHAGVRKQDQLAQMLLEMAAWVFGGVTIVAPIAYYGAVAGNSAADIPAVLALGFSAIGLGVIGAVVGTAGGTLVLRQSNFFRYFKSR